MATIKPAEVSAILKQQLSGFDGSATLDEVGTVLQIGDGIARVYGLANVQYGELVEFENGMEGMVLNLEEDNVGVVLLGASTDIKEGATVKRTERISSLRVGEGIVTSIGSASTSLVGEIFSLTSTENSATPFRPSTPFEAQEEALRRLSC